MERKMGHSYPRLGFEMGPSPPDGDRLSAISPDSQENHARPMGLQNGPFFELIAAEGRLNNG